MNTLLSSFNDELEKISGARKLDRIRAAVKNNPHDRALKKALLKERRKLDERVDTFNAKNVKYRLPARLSPLSLVGVDLAGGEFVPRLSHIDEMRGLTSTGKDNALYRLSPDQKKLLMRKFREPYLRRTQQARKQRRRNSILHRVNELPPAQKEVLIRKVKARKQRKG